jgi:hypothetical protein
VTLRGDGSSTTGPRDADFSVDDAGRAILAPTQHQQKTVVEATLSGGEKISPM